MNFTDTMKDLWVKIDSKLYFHLYIQNYIFYQIVRMLGFFQSIIFSISTSDCWLMLYLSLFGTKLEYAWIVWNSITSTHARKLECIQQKFVAICQSHLFYHDHIPYNNFLKILKVHTLHDRRFHLRTLFFIFAYSGLKCHLYLLDITDIRVLPRNFRSSSLFSVTCKISSSAICISAANLVCKDVDICRKPLHHCNRFYTNLWHSLINLSMFRGLPFVFQYFIYTVLFLM
jgi:hypothetical protein